MLILYVFFLRKDFETEEQQSYAAEIEERGKWNEVEIGKCWILHWTLGLVGEVLLF